MILLVDDEDSLRLLLGRLLEKAGFQVTLARNGAEGIRLADAHQGRIELIVTDLMMPGMTGCEMVKHIQQRRPDVRVLYLSGYTESTLECDGLLQGGANFLQMPFSATELAQRIRELLNASKLSETSWLKGA